MYLPFLKKCTGNQKRTKRQEMVMVKFVLVISSRELKLLEVLVLTICFVGMNSSKVDWCNTY